MNRHYTKDMYLEEIRKLREAAPDITMSTDIIVGLPGETEEDFQETLDLVNEVRYDSAFTFLYTKRRGTPAEKYEDQIPDDVMHERFDRLVDAIDTISAEKNAAYEGRVEEVLVEGRSKRDKNTFAGRTDGFKLVNFAAPSDLTGRFVRVRITKGKTFSLEGDSETLA
jgi:tRNA-2-methylthio-N6-dimethylallyladenosine synthase